MQHLVYFTAPAIIQGNNLQTGPNILYRQSKLPRKMNLKSLERLLQHRKPGLGTMCSIQQLPQQLRCMCNGSFNIPQAVCMKKIGRAGHPKQRTQFTYGKCKSRKGSNERSSQLGNRIFQAIFPSAQLSFSKPSPCMCIVCMA